MVSQIDSFFKFIISNFPLIKIQINWEHSVNNDTMSKPKKAENPNQVFYKK